MLRLETLEDRTSPAMLAGFRPHFPGQSSVRIFEQGYVADDCAPMATFAAGAAQGVDWRSRVWEESLYHWRVRLYDAGTGMPVERLIVFDGRLRPTDPTCRSGKFLAVLLLRAFQHEVPAAVNGGVSLEVASVVIFGRLPEEDSSPRRVGLDRIKEALRVGEALVFCTAAHALGGVRVAGVYLIYYDPHGFFGRILLSRLMRGPFEVAITTRNLIDS